MPNTGFLKHLCFRSRYGHNFMEFQQVVKYHLLAMRNQHIDMRWKSIINTAC